MRFKGEVVYVNTDESGRPVLDSAGRAEMKYRESDAKSYRPHPANLLPDDGPAPSAAAPPDGEAAPKAKSKKPAKPASSGPAVELWTDGACSGNPGPIGIGMVVIDGPHRKEKGEYLGIGTNNIAELTAIERGLDLVAEMTKASGGKDAAGRLQRVRVYSDSGYAIGLLEKGWKAKANQELVGRVRKRVAAVPNLEFVKVPGHAGVPENERCDELARTAILRGR